jgi:hypothetical protein
LRSGVGAGQARQAAPADGAAASAAALLDLRPRALDLGGAGGVTEDFLFAGSVDAGDAVAAFERALVVAQPFAVLGQLDRRASSSAAFFSLSASCCWRLRDSISRSATSAARPARAGDAFASAPRGIAWRRNCRGCRVGPAAAG